MSSLFIPSLSALNLICSADSSPETYKTLPSPFILSHSSRIRVDLPIPGSPPSKINDPLTIPPPRTLSSSPKPVDILDTSCPLYEFNALGSFLSFSFLTPFSVIFSTFCSKKVFQLLHAGHFPIHFALSYPHSLQTKIVFAAFAINYFSSLFDLLHFITILCIMQVKIGTGSFFTCKKKTRSQFSHLQKKTRSQFSLSAKICK